MRRVPAGSVRLFVGGVAATLCLSTASPDSVSPQVLLQARAVAQDTAARDATAQDTPQRPTFQSTVDLTMVDLRVLDAGGKFIRGLKMEDFVLYEDGKEQPITTFSFVDIPPVVKMAPAPPKGPRVARDVASNALSGEGRLYLIVLGPGSPLQVRVYRDLVREFLENHFGAGDQVAMIDLNGRFDLAQEFTHDASRILDRLDRFDPDFGELGDASRTMTSLLNWLGGIEGRRKAVIFITNNVEYLIGQSGRFPPAADLPALLTAAARANVSLNIIDPTGVPTGRSKNIRPVPQAPAGGGNASIGDPGTTSYYSTSNDDGTGDPGLPRLGAPSGLAGPEFRRQGLRVLAEATGGRAFGTTSNDYEGAFTQIVDENSAYYILGYASTNKVDGKFHKIKVEVKKPRLKVRARSGYVAEKATEAAAPSKDGFPPMLAKLLKSPISIPGLTLSVTAAPFQSFTPGMGTIAVVVEARGRDLLFYEDEERFRGAMEIAITAAEGSGRRVTGERGSLGMRLTPETFNTVAAHGLRILSTLDVKPGRYLVKVAAMDAGGGQQRGSVQTDVVVPDFSKPPISLSGIAIGSEVNRPALTNGSGDRWRPLGIPPTTVRVFESGDELRALVELYDRLGSNAGSTTVTTTVTSVEGTAVFSDSKAIPRASMLTEQELVTTIPLTDFIPGDYVLAVEAKNGKAQDRRQVPFSVREAP